MSSPLLQTASSDSVTTVVIALAANVLVAVAKSVAKVLTVSRGYRAALDELEFGDSRNAGAAFDSSSSGAY